jgi:hypothetical protein
MGGARFFFVFLFFADALFKKKYREDIARTLSVIVGRQYRHRDKKSIYCAALLHSTTQCKYLQASLCLSNMVVSFK